MHGAPYRGLGYVPLRFRGGGGVVMRLANNSNLVSYFDFSGPCLILFLESSLFCSDFRYKRKLIQLSVFIFIVFL